MEKIDYIRSVEQAFNQFGMSMMSDDFASKLLATLYIFGGVNSIYTMNNRLVNGILIAQQKFNIKGGEIPNADGIILIQKYIDELRENGKDTIWLEEIGQRYELSVDELTDKSSKKTNKKSKI